MSAGFTFEAPRFDFAAGDFAGAGVASPQGKTSPLPAFFWPVVLAAGTALAGAFCAVELAGATTGWDFAVVAFAGAVVSGAAVLGDADLALDAAEAAPTAVPPDFVSAGAAAAVVVQAGNSVFARVHVKVLPSIFKPR